MVSRRFAAQILFYTLFSLGILFFPQLSYSQSNIMYVEIPPHLSEDQIVNMDSISELAMEQFIGEELSKRAPVSKILSKGISKTDFIILLTKNGRPILPDYERARKLLLEEQIPPQNELSFTFNSPIYPWTTSEIDTLQTWLNDLYPTAKAIYGNPAFNITVNIKKRPTQSVPGIYNPSTNELTIRHAEGESLISKQDVIVHELIHAFHDDDIVGFDCYEEGMTRAAEITAFAQAGGYTHPWNQNHSYCYDVFYDGLNKPAVSGKNGSFLGGSALQLVRYQLAGYVWSKAYLEDNGFFTSFNQEYYSRLLQDPSIRFTEEKLKEIFRSTKPTIEGQTFDDWYSKQHIMSTNAAAGYTIFTRVNQYTVDYFFRNEYGYETPQSSSVVSWSVYDYAETLIDSGSGITNPYGVMDFHPNIPPAYEGKLKIVASANTPGGEIKDLSYRYYSSGSGERGIFGVVPEANQGTVWIIDLSNSIKKEIQSLVNGAFSFPIFEDVRGRFVIIYTNTSGQHFFKVITKDASHYFVNIDSLDTRLLRGTIHEEVARHLALEDRSDENTNGLPRKLFLNETNGSMPLEFAVEIYPNPFNPLTRIHYTIPENENVTIVIYNILGQRVKTLLFRYHEAGHFNLTWDATNETGHRVSSGIYFCRVSAGKHNAIRRMVLLK